MPVQYIGQPTFAGGEIAPSLQGRVDLAKYSTGLKKCLNFIIHPHGGASNRPGLKFVAKPKYADKKCRIIGFEFSRVQSYMIEFGDKYCRFYMNDGQIQMPVADTVYFDPSAAHTVDDFTKIGRYRVLDCGSLKNLSVAAPYGDTHTTYQVAMATNAGDSLSVVFSGGLISIGLANATPAKNAANLIQVALRAADATLAAYTVTENVAYAAARPTTGISIAAATMTTGDLLYHCIYTSGSSATNTNWFPAAYAGSNWDQQSIYEITTPYLEADLPDLHVTQSADVLYIVHPSYAPETMTRFGHSDWEIALFAPINGPFMPQNSDVASTISSSKLLVGETGSVLVSTDDFFYAGKIGALIEICHDLPSQTVSGSLASVAASSAIVGMGAWRLITHGTWTGKIVIEKSNDGGSTWEEIRAFSSSDDFNVNTFGVDDNEGSATQIRLNMTAWTSGTCNYDLTMDACTTRGQVRITAVTNTKLAAGTIVRQVGKTTATEFWSEGSWSDYRGWPSAVTFFEDRLVFAATASEPQTSWYSKTGDYPNFGVSDPLTDDDAISVNLPSRKLNGIQSMVPLKSLLVLTSGSEATIGGAGGDALTPLTVTQVIHGVRGSNGVEPIVIGNRAIYIQPMGGIVRDIGFDYTSDGYSGDDISLISNHLFKGVEITDICYQQEPDTLIWSLRSDGIMLSCTYLREQQVLAWAQHSTDGTVESIASIPGTGYNELWAVTLRGTDRFIEVMAERMASSDPEDQYFLDCGITYDGAPATVITGLDHLEGKTVAILADGISVPQQIVASGQITLSVAASLVHIGLPYTCDLQSLKPEAPSNDGSVQGRKVRCSHVITRFLHTRGGKIGPDEDHLYDVDFGPLASLEDPLALLTGDVKQTISGEWENGGSVFYRQEKPLPVTILAFIPGITVGG